MDLREILAWHSDGVQDVQTEVTMPRDSGTLPKAEQSRADLFPMKTPKINIIWQYIWELLLLTWARIYTYIHIYIHTGVRRSLPPHTHTHTHEHSILPSFPLSIPASRASWLNKRASSPSILTPAPLLPQPRLVRPPLLGSM